MNEKQWTRRAFLAATTTTAAAVITGCKTNTAKVVPRKLSPNEKINVAGIGAGGKGLGDIMSCRHENVVALCDPDWKRAEEAFYKLPNARQYKDYRKMLDEMGKEIDACTISTPDHSHAPAAYLAMNLGIHVYVQKPLTHTIAEARLLANVANKTGVITQMGNQGHCGNGVRDLCEMLWSGAIGDVKEAHIWTNRPIWPQGMAERPPKQPIPETLDWDIWLGPAAFCEYNEAYAPWVWRGWWDFGCGAIGDMACHIMDPAFWSLKLGAADHFTIEAIKQEGMTPLSPPLKSIIKYEFPARADMGPVDVYWYDGGLMPPRPAGVPEDQKLGDDKNGSLFIGTKGILTAGEYGGAARLLPDEVMKDYQKPPQTIPRVPGENPYRNWLDGIKTGEQPASNFSYAGPLTEVANLGNVALRAGKKITYDVKQMRITNDASANTLLSKEYRKGWELPV